VLAVLTDTSSHSNARLSIRSVVYEATVLDSQAWCVVLMYHVAKIVKIFLRDIWKLRVLGDVTGCVPHMKVDVDSDGGLRFQNFLWIVSGFRIASRPASMVSVCAPYVRYVSRIPEH